MSRGLRFIHDKNLAKAIPRDIGIDSSRKRRSMIDKLLENKLSPFYGRPMRDLWFYCLGTGFRENQSEPLKSRSGSIPVSALSPEALATVISLAVARKGNLGFLVSEDAKNIFKEAEECANGGLDIVYQEVFGDKPGNPVERVENHLRQIALELEMTES
jgi:hypothetical protein